MDNLKVCILIVLESNISQRLSMFKLWEHFFNVPPLTVSKACRSISDA